MNLWTDERKIPDELLELLKAHNIPKDLHNELLQAFKEVCEYGAVTYPTKARVEYYLSKHRDYLSEFFEKLEERGR